MNNVTISDRCRNIRQQLTDLLAVLENGSIFAQGSTTVTPSSVKEVLERFMLWAGNLGVLRKSTSKLSLDSRLAGSSDLRDYICAELEDMSEELEDLSNIVNGSLPNREIGYGSGSENDLDMGFDESYSYSDNPVDEAGSILQVISQGITSLLKIGILVRQPASSGTDRFHRASRDSTNAFLDRFDIDYVRHKHPKLGDGAQSSRMGRAIAKRRQFIRYCRDHKDNLAAEEEEDKAGSQKATTDKQSSKATTFVAKENLMDILQGSADILGEEDAVSLCSVSTTSESLAVLKLPRLADLSPEDDPFECPICYTLQQFRSEQAWRRHAYRDLKAYICTVGGTECDDKFFEDRTSWFDHELEQHRCNYMCVLCGVNDGKAKTTRSKLRQHILSTHGDFEADQLERLEDAGRETITSFKTNDCPFCDDWSKLMANRKPPGREAQLEDGFLVSMSRFKKHVAMHSEQLAIFALPRHEHETGIDEDASHGSDSRVIESRSSASGAASSRSGDDLGIEDHQSDQMTPTDEVSVIRAIQSRLKSQAWPTTGWQATHIQLLERVHKTSALARLRKLARQVDTWPEAVNYALEYERRLLLQSPDKPTYEKLFRLRLRQLIQQRLAHATTPLSANNKSKGEGLNDPNESEDLSRENASGSSAPPPTNTVPDSSSTRRSSKKDMGTSTMSTSREALEPPESIEGESTPVRKYRVNYDNHSRYRYTCHPCHFSTDVKLDMSRHKNTRKHRERMMQDRANSENEEHEKNKDKGTSSSHDSDEKDTDGIIKVKRSITRNTSTKDTDGMEYIGNIECPRLGYDAFMQFEDQQQGVDQSVGNSSHPPESTESLGPDGQPAARPSSPKDMTTGEPAGASNSGINATPPLKSAEDEKRQMEWKGLLERAKALRELNRLHRNRKR